MKFRHRLYLRLLPLALAPLVLVSLLFLRDYEKADRQWVELSQELDSLSKASAELLDPDPIPERVAELKREVDSTQSKLDVYRSESSNLRKYYWVFAIALALSLIVGILLVVQRLMKPLAELAEAAAKVSEGNLETSAKSNGTGDELDVLSRAINDMRLRIKDHIQSLDTNVVDMAEELRIANEKLMSEVENKSISERIAREASAAKSDFLATMSHEIRTPMNGVLGMAEDLLSLEMPREHRDRVEMIRLSGESLIRILDDILDLSKIEAGKLEIRNDSYDFHLACRASHMLFQAKAAEKNLDYTISISEEVPQFVIGDSVRTRQIVANFISNAIKFTREGSVELDVSISERDKSGILIKVKDTGPGIAKNKLDLVFEAFAQLEENRNKEVLGTGLGLAISKRLAQLMDGDIELVSELGKGSEFSLWIPCFEGDPVQDSTEWPSNIDAIENVNVLIVEDNMINQHVIHSILEKARHNVLVASNGFEALDIIQTQRLDLILMDCRMPKLNGFETAERVRSLPASHFNREVPIVALTADAFDTDKEKCFESGMNNFLTKPVNRKTLLKVVNFYGNQAGMADEANSSN